MVLEKSSSASNLFLKSDWEEGLDVIDSLLLPGSATDDVISKYQRNGLQKLKRMLLRGVYENNNNNEDDYCADMHIPRELLRLQSQHQLGGGGGSNKQKQEEQDLLFSSSSSSLSLSNSITSYYSNMNNETNLYLLSEFGGFKPASLKESKWKKMKAAVKLNSFVSSLQKKAARRRSSLENVEEDLRSYGPPEWFVLEPQAQKKLSNLLSWENLCSWNEFDIFEISNLTQNQPLLFVGWAILGSPHAQRVMEQTIRASSSSKIKTTTTTTTTTNTNCTSERTSMALEQALAAFKEEEEKTEDITINGNSGDNSNSNICSSSSRRSNIIDKSEEKKMNEVVKGYNFISTFSLLPKCLLDFLRVIEGHYMNDNPYHNNIHAADVLQTTHSLLEGMSEGNNIIRGVFENCTLQVFSLLIGAVIHDVGHPGTNNNFQMSTFSELSLIYNNKSILENHHVSFAFQLLLGDKGFSELNFFSTMKKADFIKCRQWIIEAVLGTDMSVHFKSIDLIKNLKNTADANNNKKNADHKKEEGDKNLKGGNLSWLNDKKLVWEFMVFLMHAADISGSCSKVSSVSNQWTLRLFEEFYLQGDKEKELGLLISPLCDRTSTSIPQSQIGFIDFILQPTMKVIGKYLPKIETDVLPNIRKYKASMQQQLEREKTIIAEEEEKEKQQIEKAAIAGNERQ